MIRLSERKSKRVPLGSCQRHSLCPTNTVCKHWLEHMEVVLSSQWLGRGGRMIRYPKLSSATLWIWGYTRDPVSEKKEKKEEKGTLPSLWVFYDCANLKTISTPFMPETLDLQSNQGDDKGTNVWHSGEIRVIWLLQMWNLVISVMDSKNPSPSRRLWGGNTSCSRDR